MGYLDQHLSYLFSSLFSLLFSPPASFLLNRFPRFAYLSFFFLIIHSMAILWCPCSSWHCILVYWRQALSALIFQSKIISEPYLRKPYYSSFPITSSVVLDVIVQNKLFDVDAKSFDWLKWCIASFKWVLSIFIRQHFQINFDKEMLFFITILMI